MLFQAWSFGKHNVQPMLRLVACLAAVTCVAATVQEGPLPTLQLVAGPLQVFLTGSSSAPPHVVNGRLIGAYGDGSACESFATSSGSIIVARRGGCTFTQKAITAYRTGAVALIVTNQIPSLYENGTGLLLDGCSTDCNAGTSNEPDISTKAAGFTSSACATSSACDSHRCAVMGKNAGTPSTYKICCIVDKYLDVFVNGTAVAASTPLPVYFANLQAGDAIWAALGSGGALTPATVSFRTLSFDLTGVFIWAIGVLTAGLASYRSAQTERQALLASSSSFSAARPMRDEEPVEMSATMALVFLCWSCVALVGLYFLIMAGEHVVVMFIIVVFCLGSSQALANIVVSPLLWRFAPQLSLKAIVIRFIGPLTYLQLASAGSSIFVALLWFLCRHQAWAWLLQNLLSMCLCCMFLVTIRLPGIRVAAILLSLFFLYDIFMVFISPIFFSKSVMVTVATAGAATAASSVSPGTGEPTCSRTIEERLPMLFLVPRSDYRGGYGMLGLGDIVLPGLLLSLSCRIDTIKGSGLRHGYFPRLLAGYAVGLFLAFLANYMGWTINGVQGQPALLYLVPCTLIPFAVLAQCRGQLKELWTGSAAVPTPTGAAQPLAWQSMNTLDA